MCALFKSGILTQASGRVGGLVFSHNQGGLYIRAGSTPTDPGTSFQTVVRDAIRALTSRWQETLTDAQRDAWRTYADNVALPDPFGDPRFTTGIAHYVRSNAPRIQAGLDVVDAGPTTFNLGDFSTPSMDVNLSGPDTVDVGFDDSDAWVDEDDAAMLIYASREKSPTINFFKGPYRLADSILGDSASPPTTPETVDLPFAATGGNAVFFQIRVTRADGRLSGVDRVRAIAA